MISSTKGQVAADWSLCRDVPVGRLRAALPSKDRFFVGASLYNINLFLRYPINKPTPISSINRDSPGLSPSVTAPPPRVIPNLRTESPVVVCGDRGAA